MNLALFYIFITLFYYCFYLFITSFPVWGIQSVHINSHLTFQSYMKAITNTFVWHIASQKHVTEASSIEILQPDGKLTFRHLRPTLKLGIWTGPSALNFYLLVYIFSYPIILFTVMLLIGLFNSHFSSSNIFNQNSNIHVLNVVSALRPFLRGDLSIDWWNLDLKNWLPHTFGASQSLKWN